MTMKHKAPVVFQFCINHVVGQCICMRVIGSHIIWMNRVAWLQPISLLCDFQPISHPNFLASPIERHVGQIQWQNSLCFSTISPNDLGQRFSHSFHIFWLKWKTHTVQLIADELSYVFFSLLSIFSYCIWSLENEESSREIHFSATIVCTIKVLKRTITTAFDFTINFHKSIRHSLVVFLLTRD